MSDTIYPTFFFKNKHIWIDDGIRSWQTHFKARHMKSFQSRRRVWIEYVIEDNKDPDYVISFTDLIQLLNSSIVINTAFKLTCNPFVSNSQYDITLQNYLL